MELLRIMHWVTGEECKSNPRMQRDVCSFIRNPESFLVKFKRPYEEAMGSARSAGSQTMRRAAGSYFYMRPKTNLSGLFSWSSSALVALLFAPLSSWCHCRWVCSGLWFVKSVYEPSSIYVQICL
ncbi:hypothetical protein V1524DRAFT_109487 [Lipomyces starkeyi]